MRLSYHHRLRHVMNPPLAVGGRGALCVIETVAALCARAIMHATVRDLAIVRVFVIVTLIDPMSVTSTTTVRGHRSRVPTAACGVTDALPLHIMPVTPLALPGLARLGAATGLTARSMTTRMRRAIVTDIVTRHGPTPTTVIPGDGIAATTAIAHVTVHGTMTISVITRMNTALPALVHAIMITAGAHSPRIDATIMATHAIAPPDPPNQSTLLHQNLIPHPLILTLIRTLPRPPPHPRRPPHARLRREHHPHNHHGFPVGLPRMLLLPRVPT